MEKDKISKTMNDITVVSTNKEIYGDWIVTKTCIEPPIHIKNTNDLYIGIDPGTTNFGIASLYRGYVDTWKISFKRDKNPVERMLEARRILAKFLTFFGVHTYVTVEGASYGDIYRQVELAEIRAACIWWAVERKIDVKIAQPSEIRKAVFGNGTIKGKEIWKKSLSGDAADALVCAYFSALPCIVRE